MKRLRLLEQWNKYRESVNLEGMDSEVWRVLRGSFYAGIAAALSIVTHDPEEINELLDELRIFVQAYKKEIDLARHQKRRTH